ncbi:MAG: YncE family protein [Chitinophagaceae bacterium]|nr:YncE family protein [Chitinophagaceae bacterium]
MKIFIPVKYILITFFFGLIAIGCANKFTQKEQATTADTFQVLVVEQGRNQVKLFDSNGQLLDSCQVGFNPHEIEYDSANNKVYVSNFGVEDYDNTIGTPGTSLSVINLQDLSIAALWPTYRNNITVTDTCKGPHGLKLRPPSKKELYVNVEFGDLMLVYDTETGRIKRSFPLAKGVHNFQFSATGKTIWAIAGANGIYKYDADNGKETGHFATATPVRGLTFTAKQQNVILSCRNEIYILRSKDLHMQKHFTHLGVKQIIYSCISPDGRLLFAPCPYDNLVLVIDLKTGDIQKRIPTGKAPIYVRIGPNQKQAFVSNALDNDMTVIDLSDFSTHSFGQVYKPNGFLFLIPMMNKH